MIYANLFRRILAYILDCLIAFSILVIPQMTVYLVTGGDWFRRLQTSLQVEGWILLTISLPVWVYFSLFESSKSGATLGKRMLHIRVVNLNGNPPEFWQVFLRTIVKLLPWELTHISLMFPQPFWSSANPSRFPVGLYFVYGLLILYIAVPLFTRCRQSLDDLIARTLVINQKGSL
jgi:uncharacterized RDD family membrane protein YckC